LRHLRGALQPFLTCSLLEKCYCNPDLLFRVSLKRRSKSKEELRFEETQSEFPEVRRT
jgi:hypothetical protein